MESTQQTLEVLDCGVYESNILPNNNNTNNLNNSNNTNNENKKSKQAEFIECPVWISPVDIKRNDHLLFYQHGNSESFHVNLEEYKFIVFGRSTTVCNYVLTHPTISRKHTLIGHDYEGRLQILDLNSLHGTFVDNKRIQPSVPTTLNGGERIHLGQDTSYFIVSQRNSYNQQIAKSLLSKRSQILNNNNNNNNNNEKLIQEYNDELLTFFSHLNKTYQLDKDVEGIKSTIDQLTTLNNNSNNDNIKKYANNKPNSQNSNKRKNTGNKNLRFNQIVQKMTYSNQEEQEEQTQQQVQTQQVQINDLNPLQSITTIQSSPIKQKKYSTTLPNFKNYFPLFQNQQQQTPIIIPDESSSQQDNDEYLSSPTKKFKSSNTTTTTTTTTTSTTSTVHFELPQPQHSFQDVEFNNNPDNNINNNSSGSDDELPSSLESTESESCNFNLSIVQLSSSDDYNYLPTSPTIPTTAAC